MGCASSERDAWEGASKNAQPVPEQIRMRVCEAPVGNGSRAELPDKRNGVDYLPECAPASMLARIENLASLMLKSLRHSISRDIPDRPERRNGVMPEKQSLVLQLVARP